MKKFISLALILMLILSLYLPALGDETVNAGDEIQAEEVPEEAPEESSAPEEEAPAEEMPEETPEPGEAPSEAEEEMLPEEPSPDWEFDPGTNYMLLMIDAACNGDTAGGTAAMTARNEKIDALYCGEYEKVDFDELFLLAKIIHAEAGSSWLPDEWKLCVGEVVLNRVASPEFPDTISEVVYQRGQYSGANSNYFKNLKPYRKCVELAVRLLEGERLMEPSVVFQANFRQGSGVHTSYNDSKLGWTYFCYSSKRELYVSA